MGEVILQECGSLVIIPGIEDEVSALAGSGKDRDGALEHAVESISTVPVNKYLMTISLLGVPGSKGKE